MDYILITPENQKDFASVLPQSAFGGKQTIAIGAYKSLTGAVCGAISLTQTEEDYELDWLYVAEPMRRQYIATNLLLEANELIAETGVMPVTCRFPVKENKERILTDSSEPLKAAGLPAAELRGSSDGTELDDPTFPGKQLYDFFTSIGNDHLMVDVSFSHTRFITDAKEFYSSGDLRQEGAVNGKQPLRLFNQSEIYKKKAFALVEDHLSILDKEAFDRSCIPVLCLTMENNSVPTSIMLSQEKGDAILLSYLYGKNPRELFAILCTAAAEVKANYPNAKIIFDTVSTSAMALSERFFSKADRYKIYEAEW